MRFVTLTAIALISFSPVAALAEITNLDSKFTSKRVAKNKGYPKFAKELGAVAAATNCTLSKADWKNEFDKRSIKSKKAINNVLTGLSKHSQAMLQGDSLVIKSGFCK
ncbi:hypothetical protein F9L33_05945 [Amylibacter sp. SFDW26]|uniref:hypothetical protein n=1 Tax=Amylibacter sp. SFDW26 TaxID=2652722 RepID=UPI0012625324|nr:hypothetical protein [Amylibacter sp. SFDW26]KAB7616291.1 hypothetical protein F9L33_05945 [Amylibacter sp. SFDW26]